MHTLLITTAYTINQRLTLLFRPAVLLLLSSRAEIEWGSSYIYVSVLDEGAHVAEEERKDKRGDVATIDVCISHDDDLVVTEFG